MSNANSVGLPYDIDYLYFAWNDCIYKNEFIKDKNLTDKWFNLLNEYYSSNARPFSNWLLVERSIKAVDRLDQETKKLSINLLDVLIFSCFFSFLHYQPFDDSCFEKSAEEALEVIQYLDLLEKDSRLVYSLICSLADPLTFDPNKSFHYHLFRDANYVWLTYEGNRYMHVVENMALESEIKGIDWISNRKKWVHGALLTDSLFHTEGIYELDPSSGKLNCIAQDNLIDELKFYSSMESATV
jgi:hypothetical protein